MKFELAQAIEILERTPTTLESLLGGLSEEWLFKNEGDHTWSPYDVIGHLIHGEKTDWMVRAKIILSDSPNKSFEPFDRFAQMTAQKEKNIILLLKQFRALREENLEVLKSLRLQPEDFSKKGIHPEFGPVTLRELLSTWVAHDLGHIAQISRVMAKQYTSEVGPWVNYLRILNR